MKRKLVIFFFFAIIGIVGVTLINCGKEKSSKELIDYYKTQLKGKYTSYCLKDVDGKSGDELVVRDDNRIIIYRYKNHAVEKVYDKDFVTGTTQIFESHKKKWPGLFYFYEDFGINYYGYICSEKGKIVTKSLWSYNHTKEVIDYNEKINPSANRELVKESRLISNDPKHVIEFK